MTLISDTVVCYEYIFHYKARIQGDLEAIATTAHSKVHLQ